MASKRIFAIDPRSFKHIGRRLSPRRPLTTSTRPIRPESLHTHPSYSQRCLHRPRHPHADCPCSSPFGRTFASTPNRCGGRQASRPPLRKTETITKLNAWKSFRQAQAIFQEMPSLVAEMNRITRNTADVPDDFGLFEDTLIFPPYSQRPGFFSRPTRSVRLYAANAWNKGKDLVGLVSWKLFIHGRPLPKIHFFRTTAIAEDLHKQMYTAFAANDTPQIRDIATSGLRDSLTDAISAREAAHEAQPQANPPRYRFTLHKHLSARVVSNRATALPIDEDEQDAADKTERRKNTASSIRQAIVRMRTVQSFVPVYAGEEEAEWVEGGPGQEIREREVSENVVIQKRILRGEDQGWKIWGTVPQTSSREWDKRIGIKG